MFGRYAQHQLQVALQSCTHQRGETTLVLQIHCRATREEQLDDLHRRLESARWPAEIDGAGSDYGTDQVFLRSVIERWTSGYDWRATEAELNRCGSFTTTAAGQRPAQRRGLTVTEPEAVSY